MPELLGILNLTADSFSDGGRFLDAAAAIAQGERLLAEGAAWLDLGAESSNPAGQRVPEEVEIERLRPVLAHFARHGARLAVDTCKPAVMQAALDLGAGMINDVTALSDARAVALLARHPAKVVLMFARNAGPRATAEPRPHAGLLPEILGFFRERVAALLQAGIARERLLLDPGMGYFLGAGAAPSLHVLRNLAALRGLGQPLYLCTSRKSFVGAVLGGVPPAQRLFGTLATELWAAQQGVEYIRTHEPGPLRQALALWQAIEQSR